jgi:hypothetical protein
MEIQPRRDILELWRAAVDFSYSHRVWTWGGRLGRNSVSDAEQLLTLLYPATIIPSLAVGSVDETSDDVLDHLRALGNAQDIPRRLVEFITDYMRTYLIDGSPDFSGGGYFEPGDGETVDVPQAQQNLHVVDSYSMSLTLCLSTLDFVRIYRRGLRSQRMLDEVDELEKLASARLTAAMIGLLRSFTVNTFDPSEPSGQTLRAMINQSGMAAEIVDGELLGELAEIRTIIMQQVELGFGQAAGELENSGRLFECGWSWGVVDGAPEVTLGEGFGVGKQPVGVAETRPYLYFTVAALDGIADLFSERIRLLGLLNGEQQRLARALQLRWDLTQRFWAKVATFGPGRWPIEDLPWKTTDGQESDYYSVLLTSIVIEDVATGNLARADAGRIGRLLERLAERGRITYRSTTNDPAVGLHIPGVRLRLFGSEKVAEGPALLWMVPSFSPLLLKRLLRVTEMLDDNAERVRTLDLADQIWQHIERRRITEAGGRGLWDAPTHVFSHATVAAAKEPPSWHQTERVMEALVAAANVTESTTSAASSLLESARQLLAEAEHLFDQERLRGTNDTGAQMRESFQVVGAKLRRARDLLLTRPGTATVLASDVLRELDMIDAARQDTARMS